MLQGRPHELQGGLPGRSADIGGGQDSLESVVASDDGEAGIGQVAQVIQAVLDRRVEGRSVEGRGHDAPASLGQDDKIEPRQDGECHEGKGQQEALPRCRLPMRNERPVAVRRRVPSPIRDDPPTP